MTVLNVLLCKGIDQYTAVEGQPVYVKTYEATRVYIDSQDIQA